MTYTIHLHMLQSKIEVLYGTGSLVAIVEIEFSKPNGFETAMRNVATAIIDDLRRAGAV